MFFDLFSLDQIKQTVSDSDNRLVKKGLDLAKSSYDIYRFLHNRFWTTEKEETGAIDPTQQASNLSLLNVLSGLGVPDTLIKDIQTALNKHFKECTVFIKPSYIEGEPVDGFDLVSSIPSTETADSDEQLRIIFRQLAESGLIFSVKSDQMAEENYTETYRKDKDSLKKAITRDLKGQLILFVNGKRVERFEELEEKLNKAIKLEEAKKLTMAQCTQGTCAQAAKDLTLGFQNHLLLTLVIPHQGQPQTIRIVIEEEAIKIYASKTFSYQPFAPDSKPIGIFKTTTCITIDQNAPGTSTSNWEWKCIMTPEGLG